jgi:glutathione S-transferase
MIKLYYSPGACSLASHIVLEELGVAYEAVSISIAEGEHKRADYLRINPKGNVPALNVDGKILTETVAILTYLGGGYADRGLWPKETWKQAEALSIMAWLSSSVHIAAATIFRSARFSTDPAAKDSIVATGKSALIKYYGDIDKMLQGKSFAMGGQYSVVDAYLLVFYRWGNRLGIDMKTDFPVWAKHAQRVYSRSTVRRVFEDEGIFLDK